MTRTKEIKRKTYVYAFYDDNSGEVNDARKQLEDAIKAAIEKSDDYFLTLKETEKIKEAIEEAMDVFDRTGPRATLDELWMPWTVWRKPANLSIRFWKTGMTIMINFRMEETAEVHPAEMAGAAEAMAVQEGGSKGGSKGGGWQL